MKRVVSPTIELVPVVDNPDMFNNLEAKAENFAECYRPVDGEELQELVLAREKQLAEARKIATGEISPDTPTKINTRRSISIWKRFKKFISCSSKSYET